MTPMLILLFGIKPSTAISSDLVAAVFMRPFGAAVHISKKTVNFRLVGWMVLGSVPMAFLGAYILHVMGNAKASQTNIEKFLGAALLIGAAACRAPPPAARAASARASSTTWSCTPAGRW